MRKFKFCLFQALFLLFYNTLISQPNNNVSINGIWEVSFRREYYFNWQANCKYGPTGYGGDGLFKVDAKISICENVTTILNYCQSGYKTICTFCLSHVHGGADSECFCGEYNDCDNNNIFLGFSLNYDPNGFTKEIIVNEGWTFPYSTEEVLACPADYHEDPDHSAVISGEEVSYTFSFRMSALDTIIEKGDQQNGSIESINISEDGSNISIISNRWITDRGDSLFDGRWYDTITFTRVNKISCLEHYRIKNNLEEKINISELSNNYCVATDGGASIFKLKLDASNSCQDYSLRIKPEAGNTVEEFGEFTKLTSEDGVLRFKYSHPGCPPLNQDGTNVTFLTMELVDNCSNSVLSEYKINLVPTLPVYIHGLASRGAAMSPMKSKIASDLSKFENINWVVDYSNTNNSSFETNSNVVPNAISSLLTKAKDEGCAASKVDLIGHSMGGNLSRQYIQSDAYAQDVRKLITINTPHYGSQQADILWGNPKLNSITTKSGIDRNGGAIYDLRKNSFALSQINNGIPSRNISTHGIFSNWNSILDPFKMNIIYRDFMPGIITSLATGSISNDGVVTVTSQQGGLPSNSLTGYQDLFHVGIQGNDLVIDKVKQLLLECPSSNSFSEYGYQPPSPLQKDERLSSRSTLVPSIQITSSKTSNTFKIEDTVTFFVMGQDITSNIIYLDIPGDSVYASYNTGLNGQYHFKINENLFGKQTVYAIGINSESQEVVLDSLIINISCSTNCAVVIAKAILGGAYFSAGDTMSTSLRIMGLLPTKCPYDTTLLLNTLPSTMVDWVRIDLVDTLTGDTTYASLCACLLRNGDIQNISGDSTLSFAEVPTLHLSLRVKHRNHLSTRSRGLSNTPGIPISFDFRNGTNLYVDPTIIGSTYHNVGLPELLTGSRYALWPGDVKGDGQVKYQGSANDRGLILSAVGGTVITNTVSGYLPADITLNGQVKYQGGGNDRAIVLTSIGGSNITKISKVHN